MNEKFPSQRQTPVSRHAPLTFAQVSAGGLAAIVMFKRASLKHGARH